LSSFFFFFILLVFIFWMLVIEPRALFMLSIHSATELCIPRPLNYFTLKNVSNHGTGMVCFIFYYLNPIWDNDFKMNELIFIYLWENISEN
jgi:hypothetical protein